MTQKTGQSIDLLRSDECAALLKLTVVAFRASARRGLVPRPIKLPGVGLRWRRADLERWIESQAAAQAKGAA